MGKGFRGESAPAFCIAPGLAGPPRDILHSTKCRAISVRHSDMCSQRLRRFFSCSSTPMVTQDDAFQPEKLKSWSGRFVVTQVSTGGSIFARDKGQLH